MEIFNSFTPLVEPLSLDEAFLDVTGSRKLIGTGREIGQAIRQKVQEQEVITCSVGIAPSKFIAKSASQHCKPNGLLEITEDRALEFLHPLPVSAIWGVGPKTAEALDRLGLKVVADIANTKRSTLVRALGEAAGSSLYELAWGRDYRDVVVNEPDKSISNAETFSYDLSDPEEILQELLRMTEKASARLRERDLYARTVGIKVRFADFSTITRSKTLPLAVNGTHESYAVVKALYEGLGINRAFIRMVAVSFENLQGQSPQQLVLGGRERGWREAEGAIDKAKARFGGESVRPGRLIKPD
jgi:DNA polymerase-4